jgi:hypothetical protein
VEQNKHHFQEQPLKFHSIKWLTDPQLLLFSNSNYRTKCNLKCKKNLNPRTKSKTSISMPQRLFLSQRIVTIQLCSKNNNSIESAWTHHKPKYSKKKCSREYRLHQSYIHPCIHLCSSNNNNNNHTWLKSSNNQLKCQWILNNSYSSNTLIKLNNNKSNSMPLAKLQKQRKEDPFSQ